MRPDGNDAEQVTTAGGASAWESIDGQTVYYACPTAWKRARRAQCHVARLAGGPERVIDAVLRWNFVPVKASIYYVVPAGGGPCLRAAAARST